MIAIKGAVESCPRCKSLIESTPGFRTWCPACDWNLGNEDSQFSSGYLARRYSELGNRYGKNLLAQLCSADPDAINRGLNPGTVTAAIVCGFILLAGAAVPLFGIWMTWHFWPYPIAVIVGLSLVATAWFLVPRMPRQPAGILPRTQYPVLFKLIDEIAVALKIPRVELVAFDHRFNASVRSVGWHRRPLLTIGLPLFKVLEPDQRVAIIGHELAHMANRDPARMMLLAIAIAALDEWISVLAQDARDFAGGLAAIFANMIMWLASHPLLMVRYLILNLLYVTSQKAEYFADYLAARVSGTKAMALSLTITGYAEHLPFFVLRSFGPVDASGRTILEQFRQFLITLPEMEVERSKRCQLIENARIDATHPPTAFRMTFLAAHPVETPLVSLTSDESAQIDAELANLELRMSERMIDDLLGEK